DIFQLPESYWQILCLSALRPEYHNRCTRRQGWRECHFRKYPVCCPLSEARFYIAPYHLPTSRNMKSACSSPYFCASHSEYNIRNRLPLLLSLPFRDQ